MELKNIKLERVKHNYTQKEIAKYLNVTVQTMRHYEIDPGKMPASKYFKLLDLFAEFEPTTGQKDYIVQQIKSRLQDVMEAPDEPNTYQIEINTISLKTRIVNAIINYSYDYDNYNFQNFEDTGLEYNTKHIVSNVDIFVQVLDPIKMCVKEELSLAQYCCDSIELKMNKLLN